MAGWGEEDPANGAMQRAISQRQQSPDYLVTQGLHYLKDPESHGLDGDTAMKMVDPLLQAKHFGVGGKPVGTPGSQGSIQSGGSPNQGVLGFVGHVMGNIGLGGKASAGKLGTLNGTGAATGAEAVGGAAGGWAGADAAAGAAGGGELSWLALA